MKLTELLYPFAFLPVCLLLYYVLPKRCRNAALLAASLLFFAWGTPEYLVLLVLAILLNYFAGLELESLLEDGKTGHARLILVLTILADLLRQSGLDIPLGVLTREELVGHILRIAQIDS